MKEDGREVSDEKQAESRVELLLFLQWKAGIISCRMVAVAVAVVVT